MTSKRLISLLSSTLQPYENVKAPSVVGPLLRHFSSTSGPDAIEDPRSHGDRLFNKILVANRGEIAIRVMRTARRLGIPTVAVYSDADRTALHARFADEAINIGPAPSNQSYLNIGAIVKAIKSTGADAVHPGYGFLSENPLFDEAVSSAGATFVGPPASAVKAMGDKVESKRFAKAAGVSTVPGYIGVVENGDHAVAVAKEIGYPVMVKASAGGGGKGMRIAYNDREVIEAFKLCTEEAASAFGDDRMLVEKFIEHPRHIEIQVLGDKHGTIISLPERECSIQRRNQKVIEEAPSPIGTDELRRAMGAQAVALCKAVGYHSAGTCEFMVDRDRNFYFLEMNTRLQVEHPITEAISGIDLVEQMLRVAAGEKLAISQERALQISGHAIECRVYAEDPARGFLPSIGRLKHYREPRGHGIRCDSGVGEGSEISVYYDPMVSKLVTHAATRGDALESMKRALDAYTIRGVQHNIPLLRSVLDMSDFASGDISTAFLGEHFKTPESSAPRLLPLTSRQKQELLASALVLHLQRTMRLNANGKASVDHGEFVLHMEGEESPIIASITATKDDQSFEVTLPDRVLTVAVDQLQSDSLVLKARVDHAEDITLQILEHVPRALLLQHCGAQRHIVIDRGDIAGLSQYMPPPHVEDMSKVVRSPMPGNLVSVSVKVGQEVQPGDELAVVEAMKMRNVLKAEIAGKVIEVAENAGSTVAADQVIVRFE